MHEWSRRALILSVAAASGARLVAPAAAQTNPADGAPPQRRRSAIPTWSSARATSPPRPMISRSRPCRTASPTSISTPGATSASSRTRRFWAARDGNFRLELFHLGHLFKRPVTVNVLRDGIPAPIPYASNLFDYGRTKLAPNLPVNLGFAGFRLRFPINAPHVWDEVVAFLGASYFRFLGRGQRYGLSARGLAIGAGPRLNEEFPFFREFWIETPSPTAEHIVIYALLDGESATGAFRFDLVPGTETYIETNVTLFARKAIPDLGLAPLSSMFFVGKNDRRFSDDFRGELHDSDGLLMHTGAGEWIWRPLSNPVAAGGLGLSRQEPAWLRAPAARPQFPRLPGSRARLRAEAELLDRAARGLGRGQGRARSNCRPTTRPTTTSSPPGRRRTGSRPASR